MSRSSLGVLAALAVAAAAGTVAPSALAGPAACGTRVNDTHAELAECITLAGVREHQAALQAIADENHGTRVSGSPGYDASVDYVVQRLTAAGYTPQVQSFSFNTFVTLGPAVLERVAPAPAGPVATTILNYSGSGDVTAAVTALPGPATDPTPGCEVSDYAGFPVGRVALVSRGGCTFATKAQNAYSGGASAVVIANNVAGDLDATLGEGFALDIPVTSVTQALGDELAAVPGLVLRVRTSTFRGSATTHTVLAETPTGNDANVVMAGAHLDSVNAGPGINDNGSGSAALLEVAEQMARSNPVNTVRFAWWGAEESDLVGSTRYVSGLGDDERSRIALYLNFDMVGSPNPVFFVYDGDDSDATGAGAGPSGSARIEKTFEAFYGRRGLPFKGTDLSGRSDYGPFVAAGIPSGGLFTGAEGVKTAQEAELWGGTAGQAYDPCYHRACDTVDNVDLRALDVNSDAMGFGILQYAMNTADVNGIPGKGTFPPVTPSP
ncbi:MAG TPA: M28 family metallopeptidase [Ornithinibacter sp.]|nr:M28 family metallopeptidase [Ornithinibacter sp.]